MKTIRCGDVYRTESPFSPDMDEMAAKRLSYVLGTVIGCYVLVIREPYHWDAYSTVTVIPSNKACDVGISVRQMDEFGYDTAEYRFIPYAPITIPVSRLGQYAGSLDDSELSPILDAARWIIGSPSPKFGNMDNVPNVYQTVMAEKAPTSAKEVSNKNRLRITFTVNQDGVISSNDPKMNKKKIILVGDEQTVHHDIDLEIDDLDVSFIDEEKENKSELVDENLPNFPDSCIPTELLIKYASDFRIPKQYLVNNIPPRTWSVLTEEEIKKVRGDLSPHYFETVLEIFSKMTIVDQMVYGVWLPCNTLHVIFNISIDQARVLKNLCNAVEDLTDEEYCERLREIPFSTFEEPVIKSDVNPNKLTTIDIKKLQPYLNPKMIMNIPKNLQELFLSAPEFQIKRHYTGKSSKFRNIYDAACKQYRK